MPKDRRSSSGRCRASPYSCDDKNDDRRKPKSHSLQIEDKSECEEARCPICMEHPHNAVLLLCSSFDKGCRPYMCDTGPQLSNCLNQFHKSNVNKVRQQAKLACPLCRGEINGWAVVDPARQFMDSKTRNCSVGTCDFVGNYSQLTEHASCVHPGVRPTDVDPERELEWRRLEEDMVQQDLLSMQLESDDAAEVIVGKPDLPLPSWDSDYAIFVGTLEANLENVLSEFDLSSVDTTRIWHLLYSMPDSSSSDESDSDS
ncbi:putative transcription factor C2H2 family [Helianthus annuus]|nr:putative transcription factor C2H2 family [Helianthus annuus]